MQACKKGVEAPLKTDGITSRALSNILAVRRRAALLPRVRQAEGPASQSSPLRMWFDPDNVVNHV